MAVAGDLGPGVSRDLELDHTIEYLTEQFYIWKSLSSKALQKLRKLNKNKIFMDWYKNATK